MDRAPDAHFFMFMSLSGMAFQLSHTSQGFWEVFNIALFVVLSEKSLLMTAVFELTCQASELRHPLTFVHYVGQASFKVRLTYSCECGHVQQVQVSVWGCDRE